MMPNDTKAKTRATPGTWRLPKRHEDVVGACVVSEGGHLIADCNIIDLETSRSDAECMANAHLASAAPDLLAVLIEMVQTNQGELTIQHYRRARAAIAKAEGGAK